MNNFFLIMSNYFLRLIRDIKEVVLLLIIPIGITVIASLFGDPVEFEGYNLHASMNAPALMLSFQFFNMAIMLEFLHLDFRGDMRWRLRMAPQSLTAFILPAFAANWLFSIFLGMIILAVSALFLNAYLGNLLVLAAVLLIVSLMATFLSMLIFLLTKKFSGANAAVYIISFGLMISSGFMIPLGDNPVSVFLNNYGTPLSLGTRAIWYSGTLIDIVPEWLEGDMGRSLANIGILAVITAVIAAITLITARRRKI